VLDLPFVKKMRMYINQLHTNCPQGTCIWDPFAFFTMILEFSTQTFTYAGAIATQSKQR